MTAQFNDFSSETECGHILKLWSGQIYRFTRTVGARKTLETWQTHLILSGQYVAWASERRCVCVCVASTSVVTGWRIGSSNLRGLWFLAVATRWETRQVEYGIFDRWRKVEDMTGSGYQRSSIRLFLWFFITWWRYMQPVQFKKTISIQLLRTPWQMLWLWAIIGLNRLIQIWSQACQWLGPSDHLPIQWSGSRNSWHGSWVNSQHHTRYNH